MAVNYIEGLSAPSHWSVVLGGQWRAVVEWVDGKPSKTPRLDDGVPLWRTTVTLLGDDIEQVSALLEVASPQEPAPLRTKVVPVPSSARVSVRGPSKGQYGLSFGLALDAPGLAALIGPSSSPVVKAA